MLVTALLTPRCLVFCIPDSTKPQKLEKSFEELVDENMEAALAEIEGQAKLWRDPDDDYCSPWQFNRTWNEEGLSNLIRGARDEIQENLLRKDARAPRVIGVRLG